MKSTRRIGRHVLLGAFFTVACAPPPRPEGGTTEFDRRVREEEERVRQTENQNRTRRFYDALDSGADSLVPRLRGVIAVLNFPELGTRTPGKLSAEITESVHHSLGRRSARFSLVERSQIEQLVQERQYQQAILNMTEEEAARHLGRELHADAVILGSLTIRESQVTVYMRAVAVRSAQVFGSARVGPTPLP